MARSSLVRSVIRGLSRNATPTTRTTVGFQRPMSSLGDDFMDPEKSKYRLTREESPYTLGKHRSNALELIEKQPVIEVEGHMAVCDGGGGALGHPLEYIKVGHMHGSVKKCIYCGLKYKQKAGGH